MRYIAVNNLKRHALLLGEGEWGIRTMHQAADLQRFVRFGLWNPEISREELDAKVPNAVEFMTALQVDEIVPEQYVKQYEDYTLIGALDEDAIEVPIGTTVISWLEAHPNELCSSKSHLKNSF